ncbi:MAG: ABC transporter permease [Thermoanaerobaculia bacterium]
MGNWLSQIVALLGFNLRTLPRRKGAAAAAAFGIAGVVAVFVGVLSIGEGFRRAMVSAGAPDRAIVLRSGADTEMTSIMNRDDVRIVADAPGIARGGGKALVSPELFVIINLPKRSTGSDANVSMRGVEQEAFLVRPEIEIVEGRPFAWGRNEVIVGRGAQIEFSGLELGSTLEIGNAQWEVVGIFEADGGLPESEIWTDAAVLAPAYRRGESFQSALVKLASPGNFQTFKDALTSDPRLNVKVLRETDYYAEQSQLIYLLITGLGTIIATMMGVGAAFGALNTMYTAVASRTREIGTLKALGFRGVPVVLSVVIESVLLAIVGGTFGAIVAWMAFDGYRAATMNWQSFSQVAFAFEVGPRLLANGVMYAVLIGIIGGLFPAIRAARMPISAALREG